LGEEKKMKKLKLFLLIALSFFILFPALAVAQNDFGFVLAKGKVNIQEIGGKGLYVFSIWNSGEKAWIDSEGGFSANILLSERPQKLTVKDDLGRTRAVAMAGSQNLHNVIFDAQSTAFTLLLSGPRQMRNSTQMEDFLRTALSKKSFLDFVAFFKKNLVLDSLENLMKNEACLALFEKSRNEILGQDQGAIQNSLYKAKGELERLFSEE